MTDELLRLHDAQVRRDGRIILDVDDFVMHEGERVVVLGPNGSGKSTLVKLLTREMMPLWKEEPPVLFRGNPRTELRIIQDTVGVVSTSFADKMNHWRTVEDIVMGGYWGAIGVPSHRKPTPEQVEGAYKAMEEIGIRDLAQRTMGTLSTGQQRRALVARALINAPEILVFDEPTIGLDPEAVWHLRQTLEALAKAGRSVLLVTHDVADIMEGYDRTIFLQDAHITADGPTDEMLSTERLRELFGVPLTLVKTEGRYHIQ